MGPVPCRSVFSEKRLRSCLNRFCQNFSDKVLCKFHLNGAPTFVSSGEAAAFCHRVYSSECRESSRPPPYPTPLRRARPRCDPSEFCPVSRQILLVLPPPMNEPENQVWTSCARARPDHREQSGHPATTQQPARSRFATR